MMQHLFRLPFLHPINRLLQHLGLPFSRTQECIHHLGKHLFENRRQHPLPRGSRSRGSNSHIIEGWIVINQA